MSCKVDQQQHGRNHYVGRIELHFSSLLKEMDNSKPSPPKDAEDTKTQLQFFKKFKPSLGILGVHSSLFVNRFSYLDYNTVLSGIRSRGVALLGF
ncbi:hypothetical protein ACE6H2_028567 [Prunus campanulata]